MWKDLEYGFRAAFEQAWKSYCAIGDSGVRGLPIGCVVLNGEGVVVSAAHNQINVPGTGLITGHQIAHAEIV
jgi:tRNA(Arg) A34 adenosine deaminase TadA